MTPTSLTLRDLLDYPFGKTLCVLVLAGLAAVAMSVGVAVGAMISETVSYIVVIGFFIVAIACFEAHRIVSQRAHERQMSEGRELLREIEADLMQLQRLQ